ncbi:MAG: sulfite exporter TauE/SafE family protein [Azonexus sp.]|nr:sulfite exporter TauE/SafE family protein [Betaproteobacteria bacterium]MBK8917248.1 sulfite exporter TauE/SafE family protein [Betaproteobacteria bacterium]MBP6035011.1 sulfite exporter TauE/SafE family protein [Azonexus sp.]MBP6906011.1 sulfite exporter TauE/SafE family protein [Azonexus sp.]
MEAFDFALVSAGAFLAGGMNAIAGGGTFFSFPALLAAGVPPVMANASNTVGLCPASLVSAWAYRREALRHGRWAVLLMIVSLFGGIAGGLLLLATSNAAFSRLIPWLLLVATALFAFSGQVSRIVKWVKGRLGGDIHAHNPGGSGGALFQFAVAVYGGFFGAGMGILTLAALSIQGFEDMQEINALKNLTSGINYFVASATFIIAGAISWPHTLVMLVTAMAGGYAGAAFARRLPALWLKRLVVAVGASLTVIYFFKTYF